MNIVVRSIVMLLVISSLIIGESDVNWSYMGKTGPSAWGDLDDMYNVCKSGVNQSPVDLVDPIGASLEDIVFNYNSNINSIVNNGHAIQLNVSEGSMIEIQGKNFELLQLHFHSPSEHHVDGKSYPMEVHFVHRDEHSNLAVVGVLFEESTEENTVINDILEIAPLTASSEIAKKTIAFKDIIPVESDYYRLNGSLTTPPCSEGVRWVVMKETQSISKNQIKKYYDIFGFDTNRPIQPLNSRVLVEN